ncbi:MAG: AsmA-like C-terminal domain-containing protein [Magnetococcales bacterium]|nr:AsmA-like C-terminal domain-containing protein [Magnetococcales bacterium]
MMLLFAGVGGVALGMALFPPNLDRYAPDLARYLTRVTGVEVGFTGLSLKVRTSLYLETGPVSVAAAPGQPPLMTARGVTVRFSPLEWLAARPPLGLIVDGGEATVEGDRIDSLRLRGWDPAARVSPLPSLPGEIPLLPASLILRDGKVTWWDGPSGAPALSPVHLSGIELTAFADATGAPGVRVEGWYQGVIGGKTRFSGEARRSHAGEWRGRGKVVGLELQALPACAACAKTIPGLTAPLTVELEGGQDSSGRTEVAWKAEAGAGQLTWRNLFRRPLPLSHFLAAGRVGGAASDWELEVIDFQWQSPHGTARGQFRLRDLTGPVPELDLSASVSGVAAAHAGFYYPTTIMPTPLVDWLDTSLSGGQVEQATLRMVGPVDRFPFDQEADRKAGHRFTVEGEVKGVKLVYYPGLPPLGLEEARLLFEGRSMAATVSRAVTDGGIALAGTVTIPDLVERPALDIRFRSRKAELSPLWQRLVSHPRLGWDREVGLEGAEMAARGEVTMAIQLPLASPEKATYEGLLTFDNGYCRPAWSKNSFSGIEGTLAMAASGLTLELREGRIGEFPVSGRWRTREAAGAGGRSYSLELVSPLGESRLAEWVRPALGEEGSLKGEGEARLRLDRESVDAPIHLGVTVAVDAVDLAGVMGWRKERSEPGNLQAEGILDKEGGLTLEKVAGAVGNLKISGSGRWLLEGNRGELRLEKFSLGKNRGRLEITRREKDGAGKAEWRVDARLEHLLFADILAFVRDKAGRPAADVSQSGPMEKGAVATEGVAESGGGSVSMTEVSLSAVRATMPAGDEAKNLSLGLRLGERHYRLTALRFERGEEKKSLRVAGDWRWLEAPGHGPYRGKLTVTGDEIGPFLADLDWYSSMRGGKGRLSVELAGVVPKGSPVKAFLSGRGQLEVDNGQVRRLLPAAKILGLFSLRGLPNLVVGDRPDLLGEGFFFSLLKANATLDSSRMQITSLEMVGPSLSMALSGMIDLRGGKMDLLVGLRPLQTLDEILSKVPLLGIILAGSRQTLLETQFAVTGSVDEPEVTLRPVASLTPGLIRDILFSGEAGGGTGAENAGTSPGAEPNPLMLVVPQRAGD